MRDRERGADEGKFRISGTLRKSSRHRTDGSQPNKHIVDLNISKRRGIPVHEWLVSWHFLNCWAESGEVQFCRTGQRTGNQVVVA